MKPSPNPPFPQSPVWISLSPQGPGEAADGRIRDEGHFLLPPSLGSEFTPAEWVRGQVDSVIPTGEKPESES